MTLQRMDNVLIVVEDLEAAKAFFAELGMELEGETQVEGPWVDSTVGLEGVRADIAMLRTPDGHGRVELSRFHTPPAVRAEPENAPANALGMRRIMFAVDDIDDVVARLRGHGAELDPQVPAAVARALSAEVAALNSDARAFIEGASVAGDPFALENAIAAADLAEAASRRALDQLLERELLRTTAVPRRFRFRHPIVRKAVYAGCPPGWRLGAHGRLRDELQRQGAAASELAHHVEQVATPGDEAAVAVLQGAAEEAAQLGPGPAAHWLEAALRLVPDRDVGRRLELLVPMATALGVSGRLEESRAPLQEALALLPPGADDERAALVAFLAAVEQLSGHHDDASRRLRATLAELADPGSDSAVILQIALIEDGLYSGVLETALASAQQAWDGALASGRRTLLAAASALRATVHGALGHSADWARELGETAALIGSLDDREVAERIDAPYYLAFSEFFAERWEDAVQHADRAIAVSRASGQGQFLTQLKIAQAWSLIELGRCREAGELADETVDAARLAGNPQAVSWALFVRCWIAGAVGDFDLALSVGEEAVALCADLDENVVSVAAHGHFAIVCARAGEYERALREFDLAGAPDCVYFFADRKPRLYEGLTQAALGLDRRAEAEDWVSRAEDAADGLDLPVSVGHARRARARLLFADGEVAEGAEIALAAADAQEARGGRIEAALTRLVVGEALSQAGETAAAIAALESAYSMFDACGADRNRDRAARGLRRLGQRVARVAPRATGTSGVGALSHREREIADLVAEAKTNREIAATLYISEKTVEKHLSKVFAKLEVSGRAAVGTKLAALRDEVDRPRHAPR
jgi:DNA-binding CsgD family transcriptional regulator/catechol 2,3-dioxygenase-like lactoylglutathione lyase family enzyme